MVVCRAACDRAGSERRASSPRSFPTPLPSTDACGDDAAVACFQELLRRPTVCDLHDPDADRSAFDEFVPLLRRLCPTVFERLELELIDGYRISLLRKGADRALESVVLMAHHDWARTASSPSWAWPRRASSARAPPPAPRAGAPPGGAPGGCGRAPVGCRRLRDRGVP
ncbi:MAG: hypothetical protein ACLU7P_06950 [Eggerthella lenta]